METGAGPPVERVRSILAEGVEVIYQRRLFALYSHVPTIGIALWIGWEPEVRPSNLVCVGLLAIYTLGGIIDARVVTSRPITEEMARGRARALYVLLALLGLIYDLIFLNLARHGVSEALDYLLLLVALFSAGGVATYQYLRGLAVVYVICAVGPLAIWYAFTGGTKGQVTAALLCVFIVFMSSTSLELHREAVSRMRLTRELHVAKVDAELLARTDALTGLLNRRALFEVGTMLLAGARRHDRPLSVLMLDVDHFKLANDRFGHAVGDAVLVRIAETLRGVERSSDVVGRLGGEEFAILLPDVNESEAWTAAERVREAVRAADFSAIVRDLTVTISIGVAERTPDDSSLDSIIDRADVALYEAKAQGRDRTVAAAGPADAAQG